jgi:hypothetical protein
MLQAQPAHSNALLFTALLRLRLNHHFNQFEFDAMLGNVDLPIGSLAAVYPLLQRHICGGEHNCSDRDGENKACSSTPFESTPTVSLLQRLQTSWQKLDYNLVAGGDGVDSRAEVAVVHLFQPMKSSIDPLYNWTLVALRHRIQHYHSKHNSLSGSISVPTVPREFLAPPAHLLPPALAPPPALTFFLRAKPGFYIRHDIRNYYQPEGGGAMLNLAVASDVSIPANVHMCVQDQAASLPLCVPVNSDRVHRKTRSVADVINTSDGQGDHHWGPGAILRGRGSRIILRQLDLTGFTVGRYVVRVWMRDPNTDTAQEMSDAITVRFCVRGGQLSMVDNSAGHQGTGIHATS